MEITRKGQPYKLEGTQPKTGDQAPNFELNNLKEEKIRLSDYLGQVVLISVVPDIDTRVCALQTKEFNKSASNLKGVQLVTVSNNTKEEQQEWCAGEGITMEMLHDVNLSFAASYGLYMPELEKLARAVFVVNKEGIISYMEIVPEMAQEPDYHAAIEAAKAAR